MGSHGTLMDLADGDVVAFCSISSTKLECLYSTHAVSRWDYWERGGPHCHKLPWFLGHQQDYTSRCPSTVADCVSDSKATLRGAPHRYTVGPIWDARWSHTCSQEPQDVYHGPLVRRSSTWGKIKSFPVLTRILTHLTSRSSPIVMCATLME